MYFCKVRLAGKKIEIESRNKHVLLSCRDYLARFDSPDFVVSASPDEIINEFRRSFAPKSYLLNTDEGIATELVDVESIVLYRKIADRMLCYDTLLLHGAAIAVDGRCYIFLAPSGTGKTTHILNWRKCFPKTIIINGDKPLINTDTQTVYGTPWCGKEGMNTNAAVPLAGIIHLSRCEKNSILPVSFKEMIPVLLQQTYVPSERNATLSVYKYLDKLRNIPCYQLKCNMDMDSAIVAHKGIRDHEDEINGKQIPGC